MNTTVPKADDIEDFFVAGARGSGKSPTPRSAKFCFLFVSQKIKGFSYPEGVAKDVFFRDPSF